MLAEALKKMELTYMIETIVMYNLHSTQVLNYLVKGTTNENI